MRTAQQVQQDSDAIGMKAETEAAEMLSNLGMGDLYREKFLHWIHLTVSSAHTAGVIAGMDISLAAEHDE